MVVVNFYNNRGAMIGVDGHLFYALAPTPAAAVPLPAWPHLVGAGFDHNEVTFYKRTYSVTSDGYPMINGGFDIYFVSHVPFPAPPAPEEPHNWAKVMAMSGSKAQMQVHSVSGEGGPLATCLLGALGKNVNCQDIDGMPGLSLPTGEVVNLNSVETSPTLGDYAGAAAGYFVDQTFGMMFEVGGLGVWTKHILRRAFDVPFVKVGDFPGRVQNFVERLIDDGCDDALMGERDDIQKALRLK